MVSGEINDDTISTLVRTFYAKVRKNPDLGPIFAEHIGDDWDPHLEVISLFWSNVMLSDGRYTGNPMAKHINLGEIEPFHFDIWLGLWRDTAKELFSEDIADSFINRAERIAESLQMGMYNKFG